MTPRRRRVLWQSLVVVGLTSDADKVFGWEEAMLDALLITRMQDEITAALHETENVVAFEAVADGLMALAMAQHRANFELWHEEDKARVPGVPDAEIVRVKHAIDVLNQRRNDLVEKMD